MHGDGKLYGVRPRQVSRADALWRKLFSVKGESPEPIPVVPVLGEPIEAQFLNGWRNYEDSIGVTGDATHPAQVQIQFPPNVVTGVVPPMIAVITRLEVFYTPATMGSPIKLGVGAVNVAIAGNAGKPRDFRLGLQTGQLRNQAFANQTALYSVAVDVYPVGAPIATASVHEPVCCGDQIVISPAQCLVIASFANAETIQVRYCWRERNLEPSELNP